MSRKTWISLLSLAFVVWSGTGSFAVAQDHDEDELIHFAEDLGVTVRIVHEDEWEDANYFYFEEVVEGSLNGKEWYRYEWFEQEDKFTLQETVTVTFNGKSFTGTEAEANAWSKQEIEAVVKGAASGGAETGTPRSPQQRVAELVMYDILLPRLTPRVLRDKADKKDDDIKLNQGGGPAPAQTVNVSWSASADSALRFENTWHEGGVESRRWGGSIRATWDWGKFSLDAMLPVDRVTYDSPWDAFDYTRTGIVLVPRWRPITQDAGPVDLSLGLTGFFMHAFLDEDGFEDPQHAGFGPSVSLIKDFSKLTLAAGVMWVRGYDTNGNNTGAGGEDHTDILRSGLRAGIPINDNWVVNVGLAQTHTFDMEDEQDADYLTVSVGASFVVRDKWNMSVDARRHIDFDPADNIEVHIGLGWDF